MIECVVSSPYHFGKGIKRFRCEERIASDKRAFAQLLEAKFGVLKSQHEDYEEVINSSSINTYKITYFHDAFQAYIDIDTDDEEDWQEFLLTHPKKIKLRLLAENSGGDSDIHSAIVEKDTRTETPLPWGKVIILMFFQLSEALSVNMLFPIVPFLVRSFDEINENDSSEVSYYASILASTFNFAQFLSSFWWGSWSDVYGRRPVVKSYIHTALQTTTRKNRI